MRRKWRHYNRTLHFCFAHNPGIVAAGDEEDHPQDEVREVLEPEDEEPGPLQALRAGCREEEEGPHYPRQIDGLTFATAAPAFAAWRLWLTGGLSIKDTERSGGSSCRGRSWCLRWHRDPKILRGSVSPASPCCLWWPREKKTLPLINQIPQLSSTTSLSLSLARSLPPSIPPPPSLNARREGAGGGGKECNPQDVAILVWTYVEATAGFMSTDFDADHIVRTKCAHATISTGL